MKSEAKNAVALMAVLAPDPRWEAYRQGPHALQTWEEEIDKVLWWGTLLQRAVESRSGPCGHYAWAGFDWYLTIDKYAEHLLLALPVDPSDDDLAKLALDCLVEG